MSFMKNLFLFTFNWQIAAASKRPEKVNLFKTQNLNKACYTIIIMIYFHGHAYMYIKYVFFKLGFTITVES